MSMFDLARMTPGAAPQPPELRRLRIRSAVLLALSAVGVALIGPIRQLSLYAVVPVILLMIAAVVSAVRYWWRRTRLETEWWTDERYTAHIARVSAEIREQKSNPDWMTRSWRWCRHRLRPLLARIGRRVMVILAVGSLGAAALPSTQARAAGVGVCTGHFVNPITDICWGCLFPFSVGALPIWPSALPDLGNPILPVCACGTPIPRIGIAMGFWEPVRLADVTMKPWCFVNLGGIKLDPGFDIGFKSMSGPSAVGGKQQNTGGWHVHWYMYPLIYWLELIGDWLCLEAGTIDILYLTEIDPLWQDSELTLIINPEAVIFANPLAVAACAADCVAASLRLPTDPLFWCAGCQGTMYPLNGNISAQYGHVQGSRLALDRFVYKLHREGIAWGTSGTAALCGPYIMPIIKKSQYRFQAVNPIPSTFGPGTCPPIGATTAIGSGQTIPVIGEDMGYLVWRKRNCCVL